MTLTKIASLLSGIIQIGICLVQLFLQLEAQIEELHVEVIAIWPHDPFSFTQGLAIDGETLYESTGLYGRSSLKQIDIQTGKVRQQRFLAKTDFGEGIALSDQKLIQLTWKEQRALVYDLKTLNLISAFSYEGEGWGLCQDGQYLLMSNGTDQIAVLNSETFQVHKQITLTKPSFYKTMLINDIECVGSFIYANVWQKDVILRFDKLTGDLSAIIDASGLLKPHEKVRAGPEGVLNGIAYYPSHQTFFITGKYWPWIFEVRFVSK